MQIIKQAIAAGGVGVATLGAGALWFQHELHYLLRPSVIETIAGVVTVGGGVLWASKAKASKAAKVAQQVEASERAADIIAAVREALPQGQQWSPCADKQVIDMTAPANAQRITRL